MGAFEADRARLETRGAGHAVRVAVLGGGRSSEHEVSLAPPSRCARAWPRRATSRWRSCSSATGAGRSRGEPVALEPGGGLLGADVAFPVLHGPFGEDGTVQGLLELLDVPYVGAGVAASALAMDKSLFKDLLAAHGVPQVDYAVARDGAPARPRALASAAVFVKPARLGSSVGIAKAWSEAELAAALEARLRARPAGDRGASRGRARGGVLGARPRATRSPREPGEIVLHAATGWYDYEAKYGSGGMELMVPARLPDEALETVRRLAVEVFRRHRLLGHGARGLLRGGRPGAGERAEHDPRLHRRPACTRSCSRPTGSPTRSCWTGWCGWRWSATKRTGGTAT